MSNCKIHTTQIYPVKDIFPFIEFCKRDDEPYQHKEKVDHGTDEQKLQKLYWKKDNRAEG